MRFGIFGGAFNPPHIEHEEMINAALKEGMDYVVVVPSSNAPHKKVNVPFDTRLDMLNEALCSFNNVIIDEYESMDDNIHYSYQTIPFMKAKYGNDITFIIGGDSLIHLKDWKNPDKIIKECQIGVFLREDCDIDEFNMQKAYWESKGADIKVFDYKPKAMSSSYIRAMLELGEMNNLNKHVAEYIAAHGLYNNYHDLKEKLKQLIEPKTYEHVVRTAKFALKLNSIQHLNLDTDKVLTAALLHDCAKAVCKTDHDSSLVPEDCKGSPVEHQFMGAVIAREYFKIEDDDVINAIKYHCTGKPDMTTLEKLIYSADLLEEGRTMEFLVDLRKTILEDFEQGFIACVKSQYEYLTNNDGDIYPLTIDAAEYYCGV